MWKTRWLFAMTVEWLLTLVDSHFDLPYITSASNERELTDLHNAPRLKFKRNGMGQRT